MICSTGGTPGGWCANEGRRVLKSIVIVTLVVQHLLAVTGSYEAHLDYRQAQSGTLPGELAAVWNTPAMAGRRYILLRPASGADVYLRFIEAAPGTPPVASLRTHGWNAAELLVQDADALILKLDGSPFRVIGPPADLMPEAGSPRAAQVVGPAGEVLYLTRIIPGGSGFNLGSAQTPVDRVFIAVVGGPSIAALRTYYGDVLRMPLSDNFVWRIDVLAKAHDLPTDTTFELAAAIMPRDFLVEIDGYPSSARPRPRAPGALPGGMAMVSFVTENLDQARLEWRAPPRQIAAFPYDGRRVAVTVGPAGEWLEMVEDKLPGPEIGIDQR